MATTVNTPVLVTVQASNATLATAITNCTGLVNEAVAAAKLVVHVVNSLIKIVPGGIIFDGTVYVVYDYVSYTTSVTT